MLRSARFPVRVVVLLAAALLAAACGGATVKQTTSAGPGAADDLPTPLNASAALLKKTDFPTGWVIDDSTDDSDDSETKCADSPHTATVESKTFTKELATASNSIDVYDSAVEAIADFALFRDQKFLDCFRQELAVELAQPDEGDTVKITDVVLAVLDTPKWGEDTAAVRFTLTATDGEVTFQMVMDFVGVRVGRIVNAGFFAEAHQPFDETLRNSLIGATSARIAA